MLLPLPNHAYSSALFCTCMLKPPPHERIPRSPDSISQADNLEPKDSHGKVPVGLSRPATHPLARVCAFTIPGLNQYFAHHGGSRENVYTFMNIVSLKTLRRYPGSNPGSGSLWCQTLDNRAITISHFKDNSSLYLVRSTVGRGVYPACIQRPTCMLVCTFEGLTVIKAFHF